MRSTMVPLAGSCKQSNWSAKLFYYGDKGSDWDMGPLDLSADRLEVRVAWMVWFKLIFSSSKTSLNFLYLGVSSLKDAAPLIASLEFSLSYSFSYFVAVSSLVFMLPIMIKVVSSYLLFSFNLSSASSLSLSTFWHFLSSSILLSSSFILCSLHSLKSLFIFWLVKYNSSRSCWISDCLN